MKNQDFFTNVNRQNQDFFNFLHVECVLTSKFDLFTKPQIERDQGRTAEIEHYGLTVLRFTNQDVIEHSNGVLKTISPL